MKDLFGEHDREGEYQYECSRPLADKIEIAIARIKEYEPLDLEISPLGYYVAFSGGKDSIVLERLFKLAGVKYESWYNNTTIDPSELIYFIRQHYPEVQWNNPERNLILNMVNKSCGPPTRSHRWCCKIYKEEGGQGRFKSIGVRGPESPRRKANWSMLSSHRKDNLPILCPLIYWTDRDIWQFIKMFDMPYCSLYDLVDSKGRKLFKRLGCVGCPQAGAKGMQRDFKQWPGFERLWKRGFRLYWEKYKGTPTKRKNKHGNNDRWIDGMESVDDLWEWWISGKAYKGKGKDCQTFLW